MLCCNEFEHRYALVGGSTRSTGENPQQAPISTSRARYPGKVRNISLDPPPPGSMLIKTGGTALQAISKDAALQPDVVAVSVPENVMPGHEILALAPDKSGRCIRVTVPDGAFPGNSFLVKMEYESSTLNTSSEPMAVMAIPIEHDHCQDLLLSVHDPPQTENDGRNHDAEAISSFELPQKHRTGVL